eukprot:CAMPEP_0180695736 /NCGR_PEP_ID=MMETSP1038_2-20121128/2608_1 /TAXON_ID=632150 /ORGANISM="Azadinium spinosum, Strain 3D9" /LENGTH=45 /DNA_ID= /DNA_START= /DNA_END= /DNA_ORIENTATION=
MAVWACMRAHAPKTSVAHSVGGIRPGSAANFSDICKSFTLESSNG